MAPRSGPPSAARNGLTMRSRRSIELAVLQVFRSTGGYSPPAARPQPAPRRRTRSRSARQGPARDRASPRRPAARAQTARTVAEDLAHVRRLDMRSLRSRNGGELVQHLDADGAACDEQFLGPLCLRLVGGQQVEQHARVDEGLSRAHSLRGGRTGRTPAARPRNFRSRATQFTTARGLAHLERVAPGHLDLDLVAFLAGPKPRPPLPASAPPGCCPISTTCTPRPPSRYTYDIVYPSGRKSEIVDAESTRNEPVGAGLARLSGVSDAVPFDLPSFLAAPAGQAGRVPHARGGRHDPLRRQGAAPEEPRVELLPGAGARRQDAGDGGAGGARRGDGHRLGDRGAAARVQPHQAAPAALQRPAQGRQELSLHPPHGARISAARLLPRRRQGAGPVLRAVPELGGGARDAAVAAEAVPPAALRGHVSSPTARARACSTRSAAVPRPASASSRARPTPRTSPTPCRSCRDATPN